MTELQRDSPYYDKIIPFQIYNGPDEVKIASLTLRIIPGLRSTVSAGQNERLIHFEVFVLF